VTTFVQETITCTTGGRATHDLTARVQRIVGRCGVRTGLCHLFIQHTSASLLLCENADPAVREDLETFMSGLVRDGDPRFRHTAEGPDDMSAHVRSLLTQSSLAIPVAGGRCALGTWQGIYLWEHRHHGRERRVMVTVQGETA